MEYRVGSEGWTEAAKAGLPLFCDVSARWDPEANVFVAAPRKKQIFLISLYARGEK